MNLHIKDTFNTELPADPILENNRRQVKEACFSFVTPKKTSKPEMIHVSPEMLSALGMSEAEAKSEAFLNVFTGNTVLANTNPYAMCYGGHQFGNWAGQLGDGRAINLAEVAHQGKRWAMQLKGSGETPYSRTADGLAVLRSSVREYLCSEAMHHLGVPSTRALSLALSGDKVMRDVLYDGNPAYEKGAIVSRIAPTFLRFGNFEILAAQGDVKTLKTLVDYTIKHFFSHLGQPSKETYLAFFNEVVNLNLDMVVHWQRVGFVHGVMNTDNTSILGLTIDYGPYGWLEGFDFGWTPNTTDREFKRYKFGTQAEIIQWNLYKLANALYPLIEEASGLETILAAYGKKYMIKYNDMMRTKLGLFQENEADALLIKDLEKILHLTETDMSIFFRNLSQFGAKKVSNGLEIIADAFYVPSEITKIIEKEWEKWFEAYASRLKLETVSYEERKQSMNQVNPKYVLRNYMAQLAIDAADKGDYGVIEELFDLLKKPYEEQLEHKKWFAKRPDWARNKVGCSMLSCSS
ncbi:YdiU family protein [Lutimonas halocynthiae]|uniref:protein adenylyltransferase SelO n=1 Tax=Lutimonas halocynthiae TaxID=1446477 RepID=UPI0025B38E1C|nr:YdiU family protein [Lutimonas halocynthiae]MDN3644026.1 YdiU family protein [Lutimonas halocynthiae]